MDKFKNKSQADQSAKASPEVRELLANFLSNRRGHQQGPGAGSGQASEGQRELGASARFSARALAGLQPSALSCDDTHQHQYLAHQSRHDRHYMAMVDQQQHGRFEGGDAGNNCHPLRKTASLPIINSAGPRKSQSLSRRRQIERRTTMSPLAGRRSRPSRRQVRQTGGGSRESSASECGFDNSSQPASFCVGVASSSVASPSAYVGRGSSSRGVESPPPKAASVGAPDQHHFSSNSSSPVPAIENIGQQPPASDYQVAESMRRFAIQRAAATHKGGPCVAATHTAEVHAPVVSAGSLDFERRFRLVRADSASVSGSKLPARDEGTQRQTSLDGTDRMKLKSMLTRQCTMIGGADAVMDTQGHSMLFLNRSRSPCSSITMGGYPQGAQQLRQLEGQLLGMSSGLGLHEQASASRGHPSSPSTSTSSLISQLDSFDESSSQAIDLSSSSDQAAAPVAMGQRGARRHKQHPTKQHSSPASCGATGNSMRLPIGQCQQQSVAANSSSLQDSYRHMHLWQSHDETIKQGAMKLLDKHKQQLGEGGCASVHGIRTRGVKHEPMSLDSATESYQQIQLDSLLSALTTKPTTDDINSNNNTPGLAPGGLASTSSGGFGYHRLLPEPLMVAHSQPGGPDPHSQAKDLTILSLGAKLTGSHRAGFLTLLMEKSGQHCQVPPYHQQQSDNVAAPAQAHKAPMGRALSSPVLISGQPAGSFRQQSFFSAGSSTTSGTNTASNMSTTSTTSSKLEADSSVDMIVDSLEDSLPSASSSFGKAKAAALSTQTQLYHGQIQSQQQQQQVYFTGGAQPFGGLDAMRSMARQQPVMTGVKSPLATATNDNKLCMDVDEEERSKQQALCAPSAGPRGAQAAAGRAPSASWFLFNPTFDNRSSTGLVYELEMSHHRCSCDKFESHPENPLRIILIWQRLYMTGLMARCARISGRPATMGELRLCHSEIHTNFYANTPFDRLSLGHDDWTLVTSKMKLLECGGIGADIDTSWSEEMTPRPARLATGCVIESALHVANGRLTNAFAVVRPPGQHAERDFPMGFCFFNSIAIATKVLLSEQNDCSRVLIVDWDVHHGNGIQNQFIADNRVLYISLHRYDFGEFYPGSGDPSDLGDAEGLGYNVNVAWSGAVMGDAEYAAAFRSIVMPIARDFEPSIVLVACGFDAALGHPPNLGGYQLSPACYHYMTRQLMQLAKGRVLLVLEGGHHFEAIMDCSESCVRALLDRSPSKTPRDSQEAARMSLQVELLPELEQKRRPNASSVRLLHQLSTLVAKHWPVVERWRKTIDMSAIEAANSDLSL